jgi:HD superfamily phosphodiesterase
MKDIFSKICELALPYQDKRDDSGHAVTSLKYARKLVKLENGNEDVIIPAIILHDVGWSQLAKERRMLIFDNDASKEVKREVQLEHQNEGVKLADEILRKVEYPEEMIKEILEIISGHDTREGFISQNEGLVRDADKLWRTSREGFAAAESRRKAGDNPRDEVFWKKIEEDLHKPGYFYSKTAYQMASADYKLRFQESTNYQQDDH